MVRIIMCLRVHHSLLMKLILAALAICCVFPAILSFHHELYDLYNGRNSTLIYNISDNIDTLVEPPTVVTPLLASMPTDDLPGIISDIADSNDSKRISNGIDAVVKPSSVATLSNPPVTSVSSKQVVLSLTDSPSTSAVTTENLTKDSYSPNTGKKTNINTSEGKSSTGKHHVRKLSARELRNLLGEPDALKYITNRPLKDLYNPGFDIANRDLCAASGASLKLVIFVESARTHDDRRMAIRQTYGHYALRKDIKLAFVIGRPKVPQVSSSIIRESELYGDIIAGRFTDSFKNLTLKTTSILQWTMTYCPEVKFIFKTDDDVFLNVPRIIELIKALGDRRRAVIGQEFVGSPERSPSNTHYVTSQEYSPPVWPKFVFGQGGYLITTDIVRDLYEKGLDTPYLNQEDIFYSAFVLQAINGTKTFINDWHVMDSWFQSKCNDKCNFRKNVSIFAPKPKYLFYLWRRVLENHQTCRPQGEDFLGS